MSPERRRWITICRAVRRGQIALGTRVLERMGTRDSIMLNLDEKRDIASLVALCERAAVLCDRLIASLSDADADADSGEEGAAP